jgi:hypothetical protein
MWRALMPGIKDDYLFKKCYYQMIGGMHPAPVGNKVLKGVMEKNQRTNE